MNKQFQTILKSKNGWFDFNIKEFVKYRDLVFLFVKRDFISLYKQTILGPAWAIIQPLLTTVVYTLIFGNVAKLAAPGVPAFIFYLTGNIIWTYFSSSLTATANTFVTNSAILGKVYFPRLVMPFATVISNLITMAIQYGFMICFIIFYLITNAGIKINYYAFLTPVLVIQLLLLSFGFGIIISAVSTRYRDLKMLITFGLQLWQFGSPVAYDMYTFDVFSIGGKYHTLYMLNPVTPIINIFRYGYLGIGAVELNYYLISWVTTIIILLFGIVLFSRVEKTFMDTI